MRKDNQQIEIDGKTVTFGPCDDDQYEGKHFVSIGTRQDHTTFIVSPDYATLAGIKSRGIDQEAWRMIAIAITSGYWD